jgi:hypothetical protein
MNRSLQSPHPSSNANERQAERASLVQNGRDCRGTQSFDSTNLGASGDRLTTRRTDVRRAHGPGEGVTVTAPLGHAVAVALARDTDTDGSAAARIQESKSTSSDRSGGEKTARPRQASDRDARRAPLPAGGVQAEPAVNDGSELITRACRGHDLVSGGVNRVPVPAEGVDALALRVAGLLVAGEHVKRVPVIGDLRLSVGAHRRRDQ